MSLKSDLFAAFTPSGPDDRDFVPRGLAALEKALDIRARLVLADGRIITSGGGAASWKATRSYPVSEGGHSATLEVAEKNPVGRGKPEDGPLLTAANRIARTLGELYHDRGDADERTPPAPAKLLETLKIQAETIARLGAERDLLENILAGTPNGVMALNRDRTIVMINRAARRLFKIRKKDPPPEGTPVERFIMLPSFSEALARVLSGASELETVEITLGSDPAERIFAVKIFRLKMGEMTGATLIIQDLTEQRKMDEQLRRMVRVASIGQLAAGIAHEIRNPLTGIAITLDIIRDEKGLSENGREMVADMSREIDRLEALVRGLLDFARPQPAQTRPMRLAKALEWHRTFSEQCRKKGVRCETDMVANPKIVGNPERLKQLFLNLAINALEATEPGGTVYLRTGLDASTRLKERARVEISDTGRGMDEATLRRIFDPFFTTKSDGTGLGLAIAHTIVEQHGGTMTVKSSPGGGTVFAVELPCHEGE